MSRRIEAVTGTRVLKAAMDSLNVIDKAAETLKANRSNIVDRAAASISDEVRALKKENEELKKAAMGDEAGRLLDTAGKRSTV